MLRKSAGILSCALVLLFCLIRGAFAERELGLAEIHDVGYPTELAVEEFARLAVGYSGGSLAIAVYPGSQITGNERTAIEMVQKGQIAFARVSVGPLGAFDSRFNVFALPYLFDSRKHMWAFLEGPYGHKMLDGLAAAGLIGLCWYDAGARSFYARIPLRVVSDLKGLKIRTHTNTTIMRMVDALGAEPVPLGTRQTLPALENGTVDGAENNPPSLLALGHYRVARHYLLTEHLRLPEVLLMNKALWERLSSEQQLAIRRAAAESVAFQRSRWEAFEAEAVATLAKEGVQIVLPSDVAPFRRVARRFADEESPHYREALQAVAAVRPWPSR